jgi:DNA-binding XRE family transcriptional regulator
MTTKDYPAEARERLGTAHRRARQVAGYKARTHYAKAIGVALRSIVSLEKGDPVGEYILEAVGRFLPTWDEDTPKVILEGGPIPPNEPESYDLVRMAVKTLVDLEVHRVDATRYNEELARLEIMLKNAGAAVDITSVRKEAHRIAVELLATPQINPSQRKNSPP